MLKGFIVLLFACALLPIAAFSPRTICGISDDREFSQELQVGRLIESMTTKYGICTTTMISKTCGVTAGHCNSTYGFVEFNTPVSTSKGEAIRSIAEDIYKIDKSLTKYVVNSKSDWGVVKVMPNEVTGLTAGEKQGFYPINFTDKPRKGDVVRITGYGVDRLRNERNLAQKTHSGDIRLVTKGNLEYSVDTTGGNSGSAVINEDTGEIIGVHTNGGCYSSSDSSANSGTIIYKNTKFIKAIKACLASE
jgi:V8-like Glu-specific endopeptidase